MSLVAGSIQIELEALDKGFKKGFDDAEKSLLKFEDKAEKGSKNINKISEGLLNGLAETAKGVSIAVGVGIAAFAGYGAKLAIDYEKQLSGIKALTGASADQMKLVSDLAVDLGNKTKFSAIEAAQGAEELLKAGVSLEQVMGGGLAGALDLAAAGELSVAESAEIASTALNAFKKDGLSVSQTADILAGSANASATSVQELKFGLSQVSAVASGVGLNFKDTSTALAVFAQNGLKGSDAGTSLKTMLLNLQPTTKGQIAMFEELGLMTENGANQFFTAEGKVKDLAGISGILNDKLKDLTDQQRLATLETLFGSDAIRAANILYKEGADGINNMSKEMLKFTAQDVAREKTNNLAGAFERLKGTIDTKSIQLFSASLPNATSAIEKLDEVISSINIENIDKMIGGFFGWINNNYILVVSALTGIASVLATLMVPALVSTAVATWAVLAPLLPMIAVIFLVVTAFTALALWVEANMPMIQQVVGETFTNIGNFISNTWTTVTTATNNFISWITTNLINTWTSISTATTNVFDAISNAITTVWETIEKITAVFFLTLYGIFTGDGELLLKVWEPIADKFWEIIGIAYNAIMNKTKETFEWLKWSVSQFGENLKNSWNGFWQSVQNKTKETFDWIIETAPKTWNSFIQGIKDFGSNLKKGSDEAMKGMGDRIWEAIQWIMNLDMGQIGKDIIQGMINGIISMGTNLKNAVGDAVNNAVNSAKQTLGIQSPSKVFYEIGGYTMEGMQDGITDNISMPTNAIDTATMATVNQSLDVVATSQNNTPTPTNISLTINGHYLGTERDKRDLVRDLQDALMQVLPI
jgi:TP901 family phage tail tape measure protein